METQNLFHTNETKSSSYFALILEDFCNKEARVHRSSKNTFCYIDIKNYFMKTEILNKEPRIFLLYDVFSEQENQKILESSKESLKIFFFAF